MPHTFSPWMCKDNRLLKKQAVHFVHYAGNSNSKAVS